MGQSEIYDMPAQEKEWCRMRTVVYRIDQTQPIR